MKFSGITSDGASNAGNLLFANRKMSRKLSRVGRAHRELLNYLWPKTLRQLSQPLMTRRSCEKSFKSAKRPSAVLPREPRIWFIINLIAKNTSTAAATLLDTPNELRSATVTTTMWRWCTIHVCVINESSWISLPAPASFMSKLWTAMKFKFIHQTFNNYVPVLLLLGINFTANFVVPRCTRRTIWRVNIEVQKFDSISLGPGGTSRVPKLSSLSLYGVKCKVSSRQSLSGVNGVTQIAPRVTNSQCVYGCQRWNSRSSVFC